MLNGKEFVGFILVAFVIGFFVAAGTSIPLGPGIVELFPGSGVLGNAGDLISFSIQPKSQVEGVVPFRGTIKGAYFFEANILVNILDKNKKLLRQGNALAMTDWMTVGPVDFEGNLDFSGLPTGKGYIEIKNDNPSGEAKFDKSILIPVIIK